METTALGWQLLVSAAVCLPVLILLLVLLASSGLRSPESIKYIVLTDDGHDYSDQAGEEQEKESQAQAPARGAKPDRKECDGR